MHSHHTTLALAVAVVGLAPAGALAQPAREATTPAQNLQSPDARDAGDGRGTANSPRVVVVKLPSSAAEPASSAHGIDWGDAGIGAGSLLGLSLVGLGGAYAVGHRRRASQHAPAAM
jgi:hypothetical protein